MDATKIAVAVFLSTAGRPAPGLFPAIAVTPVALLGPLVETQDTAAVLAALRLGPPRGNVTPPVGAHVTSPSKGGRLDGLTPHTRDGSPTVRVGTPRTPPREGPAEGRRRRPRPDVPVLRAVLVHGKVAAGDLRQGTTALPALVTAPRDTGPRADAPPRVAAVVTERVPALRLAIVEVAVTVRQEADAVQQKVPSQGRLVVRGEVTDAETDAACRRRLRPVVPPVVGVGAEVIRPVGLDLHVRACVQAAREGDGRRPTTGVRRLVPRKEVGVDTAPAATVTGPTACLPVAEGPAGVAP